MELIDIVKYVGVIFALGFLTESMVEYIFGKPMDRYERLKPHRWMLMYLSAAVGVGLSWFYQLDLIALIFEGSPTWVGVVLTGLSIGRGANYLHQFVSTYLDKTLKPLGDNPWG
jgi:hypothetical protein